MHVLNYFITIQVSLKEEKKFWIKMLNDMKEDNFEVSKIGLAELMAEYFCIPRSIKLNTKNGLLQKKFLIY